MFGGFAAAAAAVLLAASAVDAQSDKTQRVVRGVNLGGWLVTEPWMTPSLFSSTNTSDEWHLCNELGKDKCLSTLQDHWTNFYTRDDFQQMKDAGLNSVRIPLGYWAVDLLDFEPYVAGQYPHLIQAVQWAKEMDFTVMIDIHGAPGSQNGWEETGLVGPILFTANQSNTDRTLNVLKNLTTEFTKEQYGGVVTNIELMNEPIFADALLREFYTAGAKVVGKAADQGINTTIHDAFYNPPKWKNYDPNNMNAPGPAPYITLDTHQFWAFPPLDTLPESGILTHICDFATQLKAPDSNIPPTLVGEWSLSTGITANSSTQSADDRPKRTWFRTVFEAQNAAYAPNAAGQSSIGWYFWSWKTEYDIDAWSYRKGVQQGYIPSNISDPSTYAFPIGDDGCIDASHSYTAPATVSTSSYGSSSPTSSSGSGSSGSSSSGDSQASGSASPSKQSAAPPAVRGGLTATLALVIALAFGICVKISA